jgi:hypothetical protein
MRGTERRLELTGRRRARRARGGGGRTDSRDQYEYRCRDCGHVGWTRHKQISERWAVEFGACAPLNG